MRIFLLGFMGCGKSHSGRELAGRLDYAFLDLDERIEKEEKRSISDIFRVDGEETFRQIERYHLRQTIQNSRTVIACGGGTPCFFENMTWMKEHGQTIYLKTGISLLYDRLRSQKDHRPLLAELDEAGLKDFLRAKLEERAPCYEKAAIIYEQIQEGEDVAGDLIRMLVES